MSKGWEQDDGETELAHSKLKEKHRLQPVSATQTPLYSQREKGSKGSNSKLSDNEVN